MLDIVQKKTAQNRQVLPREFGTLRVSVVALRTTWSSLISKPRTILWSVMKPNSSKESSLLTIRRMIASLSLYIPPKERWRKRSLAVPPRLSGWLTSAPWSRGDTASSVLLCLDVWTSALRPAGSMSCAVTLPYPRAFSVRLWDRPRLKISTIDDSMVRYVERAVEFLDHQGKSFPDNGHISLYDVIRKSIEYCNIRMSRAIAPNF